MNFEKIPYESIIASVEFGLKSQLTKIKHNEKSAIRNEICNILKNAQNKESQSNNKNYKEKQIRIFFNETKKFLNDNSQLLVTYADKGNVTVVMDKNLYFDKMENLLNDANTYQVVSKDPTESIQRNFNALISDWEKRKYFSSNKIENAPLAKFLRNYNGVSPKMYGLPKIHKENIPIRPKVSYIGSPLYNFSKFYANILSKMIGAKSYSIRNSYEFKDKIEGISINRGNCIISLDVVSLFTNIPNNLVIAIIRKKWKEIKPLSSIKNLEVC